MRLRLALVLSTGGHEFLLYLDLGKRGRGIVVELDDRLERAIGAEERLRVNEGEPRHLVTDAVAVDLNTAEDLGPSDFCRMLDRREKLLDPSIP